MKNYTMENLTQPYKILIVDDNQMSLKIAKSIFDSEYDIVTFNSNKSAKIYLNSLKEEKDFPDIILLDIYMPEEGGFEMAEFLKKSEQFKHIPFIFQSGNYEPELQEQGFELGASDFILKPYNRNIAKIRINKAIEMSRLQNNLQEEVEKQTFLANKRTRQLEKNTMQIVDALLSTIETNDYYTKGHSARVSKICVEFAKKVGYPKEKIEWLQNAGLLHDIGKIGVSNYILNKPDHLSMDEYSKVKLHSSLGNHILSNIENFKIEADVALHHHEWWNGSGYPEGLKKEEISIEARIVSIADVFDVMKAGRIYQQPKTNEEIANEFEKMAGTQFDPILSFQFAQIVRKGEFDYIFNESFE